MLRICRDFTLVYILAVVLLLGLSYGLALAFQIDLGSGTNVVPAMVGAMAAGQQYGKRTGSSPTSGYSWQAAFWMLTISVALGVAMFGVFALILGAEFTSLMLENLSVLPTLWIVAIIAIVLVVYLLVPRFFFAWGARKAAAASQKDLVERF